MIDQQVVNDFLNTTDGLITEFNRSVEQYLRDQIEIQYIELNDLGVDFIGKTIIDDNIYLDFISYINDNYISIINVQNIYDNPIQLQIVGKSIYEILCVDMVNEIIPKLLKNNNIQDSNEIILLSEPFIKDGLFNISKSKLLLLKGIYKINNSNQIRMEIIKNALFVDMIDNDIEPFLENFIFPISEKYNSVFYSRTLHN